jgi:tRNA pseudouridine55 synthase
MLHGLLLLDKPSGMTSMSALARVKRALRCKKAGHTGTLDPLATGILPICFGHATRLAELLLASEKSYEAEILLGVETDTLDSDGTITQRAPLPQELDEAMILAVLQRWHGEHLQRPPAYSALKIQGQRAYDLARAGEAPELAPRPITIHRLELLAFAPPTLRLACHVSKGTYIRSLARDIGHELGCGAHLTALRRTQVGSFLIQDALSLNAIENDPEAAQAALLPLAALFPHAPLLEASEEEARRLRQGLIPYSLQARYPSSSYFSPPPATSEESILPTAESEESILCRILDPQGQLVALLNAHPESWSLLRVFA